MIQKFGLIGKSLSHSFSKDYFNSYFDNENLEYNNYELSNIDEIKDIKDDLSGFNITIPYKTDIIKYLDWISDEVKQINACNCVKNINGKLYGFNTDIIGFENSLKPLLKPCYKNALIFGTGGVSKAISHVLDKLNIKYHFVSRTKNKFTYTYNGIDKDIILNNQILINCTPVGTYPDIKECIDIPYNYIDESHLCYDLIYNPPETEFLLRSKNQGAIIKNGYEMLKIQAIKSWEIWDIKI